MRIRRVASWSVAAIAIGGLLTAPSVVAASPQGVSSSPRIPVAGHIAYFTKGQKVDIASVLSDGTTFAVQQVGPVSKATSKKQVIVFDLVASGDGKWLAWGEQVTSHHPLKLKTVLVLRNESNGHITHLVTPEEPVGFAGDQLVTSNADTTKRLVLTPTPHLVKVHSAQFPLAAYRKGVADTINLLKPAGPKQTWRLRLTSFGGKETTLHNYVLAPTDYRSPDGAWVSGDGKHMVVELGNHQDFGGIGPSSLADEFALTGSHARTQLGHYGTNAQQWRVGGVAYAGSSDAVWAMWERATTHGATSVVASYAHGTWTMVTKHGIAVAANAAGYVISQPGKFVVVNKNDDDMAPVPTGDASLIHGSTTLPLQAEGSAFVWVAS
jgi:hypothetical protein